MSNLIDQILFYLLENHLRARYTLVYCPLYASHAKKKIVPNVCRQSTHQTVPVYFVNYKIKCTFFKDEHLTEEASQVVQW